MPADWEPAWDDAAQRWRVDFTIEGQRVRKRLGVRDRGSRAEARALAQALYKSLWQRVLSAPEVTAKPFYLAAKGYVDAGGEARFLPRLITYFGQDADCADIGEPEITAAGIDLYPHAAMDTRRRQVRVPINAVLRFSRGERRRPSTDRPTLEWLTPEEFEPMLGADADTVAKLAFLVGSGARTGEMLASNVTDWNMATRQVWIPADETGAGKTPLAARMVRLPVRAAALIGARPEVGRAFLTPKGKPYILRQNGGGQIKGAMDKAVALAQLGTGRKITPHVLRHTWATWFYAQTRDFGALMDLGGWSKADMANRYRKIAPDDLADRLYDHGWDFRQEFGNFAARPILNVVKQDIKG